MNAVTMSTMDCLFCSIVAGDIPSRQVYADDFAVAFLDINPLHPGHTLVVPRRHVSDLLDDPTVLAQIAPAITATGQLLVDKLGAAGLNMMSSVGKIAGQEVMHLHVHLIPRMADKPGLRQLMVREPIGDLDAILARIVGGEEPR